MSEDTSWQLAHHGRPFLSQLDHSKHVAPALIGNVFDANSVFISDDVLVTHSSSGRAVFISGDVSVRPISAAEDVAHNI